MINTEPLTPNDYGLYCDFSILTETITPTEVAELYTIGSMLNDASVAEEALRKLAPTDFATHHRVAFESIARIVSQRRTPDAVAVFEDLKRTNNAKEFPNENPVKFLSDAVTFCVSGNHFDHFQATVKDHSAKRKMHHLNRCLHAELSYVTAGIEGAMLQQWTNRPAGEIASEYALKIAQAGEDGSTAEMVPMNLATINASKAIDEYHRPKTPGQLAARGVTTGIRSVDEVIPSMEAGELVIVAARPGVGKSSLMLQVARNVAATGGRVLFFALEMPSEQLVIRMISMTSGVGLSELRGKRKLTEVEADKVFRSQNSIASLPICFSERRGLSASEIAMEIKRAARRNGKPSLILVDYLQLIKPENLRDNRNYQLGQTTKILRNVAGEVGCPIICGAQLNRAPEDRDGKPRLSDIRDSGEIEQDSDIVMFLHPNMQTANQPIQNVDLVIAKQRNGPLADVPLQFVRSMTKFIEPSVPM